MKTGTLNLLRKLFIALMLGQLMFAGVVLYILKDGAFSQVDLPVNTALMIGGAYVLVTASLSWLLFRSRLERSREKPLRQQLEDYRTSCIMRWGLLESGFFLSVVLVLITNRLETGAPGVLSLMLYLLTYPSTSRIAMDLNCDWRDLEEADRRK